MGNGVRAGNMLHVGWLVRVGLALMCIAAGGCEQQLTFERWQTIHKGMSRAQVRAALGQPWQATAQTWVYYDEQRGAAVMVWFDGDKVIGTTWQSPQHGLLGESPVSYPPGREIGVPPAPPEQGKRHPPE